MKIRGFVEEIFDFEYPCMLYNLKLPKWKYCAFSDTQCAPQKCFSEGPICMSGSRWMNFQKQLRKVGFDDYRKHKSKNAYPRLRTFGWKIRCVLSFQAIYIFFYEPNIFGTFLAKDFVGPNFFTSKMFRQTLSLAPNSNWGRPCSKTKVM